jgi:hypothetical protein
MWSKTYSKVFSGIRKEEVFRIWADINHYTDWHDDLDYCKLEGEFALGNHFLLKPKGAPEFKVKIIELIENQKFVDCTNFIGAKMVDIHEIEETPNGLRISNTIKVTGILSFLWVFLVAKNVAESAPKETEALVNLVRKKRG